MFVRKTYVTFSTGRKSQLDTTPKVDGERKEREVGGGGTRGKGCTYTCKECLVIHLIRGENDIEKRGTEDRKNVI